MHEATGTIDELAKKKMAHVGARSTNKIAKVRNDRFYRRQMLRFAWE